MNKLNEGDTYYTVTSGGKELARFSDRNSAILFQAMNLRMRTEIETRVFRIPSVYESFKDYVMSAGISVGELRQLARDGYITEKDILEMVLNYD